MAHRYDITLEQQLTRKFVLSVAYVGTLGRNLLRFTTPNLGPASNLAPSAFDVFQEQFPIPLTSGRVLPPARPVAGVGAINQFETTATSHYNSLQIELRGRFRGSMQLGAAYTLSKATDDASDVFDLAGAPALPQNSLTLNGERGPANFDSRHRLSYDFVYDVPETGANRAVRALLRGLQLAGTGSVYTGQPFTVNSIFDVNLDGNLTDRLNTTNGIMNTGNREQPLRLTVDPITLLAPIGQDGAINRNTFRAGTILDLDLAMSKRIGLGAGRSLLGRADIFNLTNRTNFGIPGRFLEAPGFGLSNRTVTPARRIQLGIKYLF